MTASAAPCASLAAKSAVKLSANANNRVAADNPTSPQMSGPFRPMRSDHAPIGIETLNNVTPKDANSNPIIVGEAPIFWPKSGNTGTAIE